jgi:hypothetical protein
MAQINAPLLARPSIQAAAPSNEDRASEAVRPVASAHLHSVSNLIPEACARLHSSLIAMQAARLTAPEAHRTSASRPALPLTTARNAGVSSDLSVSAQDFLRSLPATGVIGTSRNSGPVATLSVTASAAAFSALATAHDFNELADHLGALALPAADIARGAAVALRDLPAMDEATKLSLVVELVKGGARCNESLKHLGISHGPDVSIMESRILEDIGFPLAQSGLKCREIGTRLGILDGPSFVAFELDVVRELGLPLLEQGLQPEEIISKLGIWSGCAAFKLKEYVREIEAGRQTDRSADSQAGPGLGDPTTADISALIQRAHLSGRV